MILSHQIQREIRSAGRKNETPRHIEDSWRMGGCCMEEHITKADVQMGPDLLILKESLLTVLCSWGLLASVPWQGEINREGGWLIFGRNAVTLGSYGEWGPQGFRCIMGARCWSTKQEAWFLVSFHIGSTYSYHQFFPPSFFPIPPQNLFGLSPHRSKETGKIALAA